MGIRECSMGNMGINPEFWRNRSVFVTGHTGFKGGWISLWLHYLGAKVYGYSLEPPTKPSFFHETNLGSILSGSVIGDIRDFNNLKSYVKLYKPSIVFHLAAQPLVRDSYELPVETFTTNICGTVNVLESVRFENSVNAVVVVTTDKVYENKEWYWPYREDDTLGGFDPYSSSKACSEIVTSAYRDSFFRQTNVGIATARAGNVIGGGDWAKDRLIPDFFRSIDEKSCIMIRSPLSTRPWQHVLEPLSGYLSLAENLTANNQEFSEAWNFGPSQTDNKQVSWVLDYLTKMMPSAKWGVDKNPSPHEAGLLKLDSSKAYSKLLWSPTWSLESALDKTYEWFDEWKRGSDMKKISLRQIQDYQDS